MRTSAGESSAEGGYKRPLSEEEKRAAEFKLRPGTQGGRREGDFLHWKTDAAKLFVWRQVVVAYVNYNAGQVCSRLQRHREAVAPTCSALCARSPFIMVTISHNHFPLHDLDNTGDTAHTDYTGSDECLIYHGPDQIGGCCYSPN